MEELAETAEGIRLGEGEKYAPELIADYLNLEAYVARKKT